MLIAIIPAYLAQSMLILQAKATERAAVCAGTTLGGMPVEPVCAASAASEFRGISATESASFVFPIMTSTTTEL